MLDWLRRSASLDPLAVAIRFSGRDYPFVVLDRDVDVVAGRLRGLGIGEGVYVGLAGSTTVDLVLTLLALGRLDAVPVLLNVRWSLIEARRALAVCGAGVLLSDGCFSDIDDAVVLYDYTKFLAEAQYNPTPTPPEALDDNAVACAIFTSGTSGIPKAVELTFANLLHNAALTAFRLGVRPDDRWLCCLPLFHIGGLAMLYRAVLYGLPLVLHEKFDVDAVNTAIDHEGITHISLVPTMLARLLDARTTPPPHRVTVLLGGAAASAALVERGRRFGFDVLTTYGLSEATSQVATQSPDKAGLKIGSVGRPVPFVDVTIRGADGSELPPGQVGEVFVSGPTVMRGYVNDPAATAAALTPYGLRSGDLGYIDADGDLWLVSRRTDLIISGGENIYPAEVEAALLTLPGITAACVVAVDDPEWGQSPAAAIVSEHPYTLADLRTALNPILARYKHPRRLLLVDALPTLANGKIDRISVVTMFKDGPDQG